MRVRGSRTGAARRPTPRASQRPGDGRPVSEPPAGGGSLLASAAAPLLDLVSRLQFLAAAPDLEGLRGKAIEELQRFERQAAESGASPDRARVEVVP